MTCAVRTVVLCGASEIWRVERARVLGVAMALRTTPSRARPRRARARARASRALEVVAHRAIRQPGRGRDRTMPEPELVAQSQYFEDLSHVGALHPRRRWPIGPPSLRAPATTSSLADSPGYAAAVKRSRRPDALESVPKCAGIGAQVLPERVPKFLRKTHPARGFRNFGTLSAPGMPSSPLWQRRMTE